MNNFLILQDEEVLREIFDEEVVSISNFKHHFIVRILRYLKSKSCIHVHYESNKKFKILICLENSQMPQVTTEVN